MSNGFDLTQMTPFERSVIDLLRSLSVAAWVTAFLVGGGAVMILLALLGY
jgi:hypothetical protein